MPHLIEGQPARLEVGESIACRVIGFSGPEVVLALETQPEEEIQRGDSGVPPARDRGEAPGASAARSPRRRAEEVVLRLTDDIRLGQRRVFSRAPIPLPVRVKTGSVGLVQRHP